MTPAADAPIGIMDSGVGGLTVARAIADQLPQESLRYVGDTAHSPYGPRPQEEVRAHALAVMDSLVATGVKLLVIACNTASAACLTVAQERYDVPVIEVIDPAVRRAVAVTRNRRVGVIGTVGTIGSGEYPAALRRADPDGLVVMSTAACPRFAEFVERGVTSGRQLLGLAESYLAPITAADVDTLILGCTHYPLLAGLLSTVVGPPVTLVSSAQETALDVYRTLAAADLLRGADATPPVHEFASTGAAEPFARLSRRFLGGALVTAAAADKQVTAAVADKQVTAAAADKQVTAAAADKQVTAAAADKQVHPLGADR